MCKNSSQYGTSQKYTLSPDKFGDAVEKEEDCTQYWKKALKTVGLTFYIIGSLSLTVIKEKCNNGR